MATSTQILAKIAKLFTATDKAHDIVNGPASGAGSTVAVTSGTIPTMAKQAADFAAAGQTSLDAFEDDKTDFNNQATLALNQFATNSSNAIGVFETNGATAIEDLEDALEGLNLGTLSVILNALNLPTYANLAAANAGLNVGKLYFDTALNQLNVTTA